MGIVFLISQFIIFLVISLLVGGSILIRFSKTFKIEKPPYKKSFFILIIFCISVFAIIIFNIVSETSLFLFLLVALAIFFAFHCFLVKYSPNTWKKYSLGIYVVFASIGGPILAIVIMLLVRLFIVQPFYVEGQSMEPSFNNGEYFLIDELTYRFRAPERGEVIIFKAPISTDQSYIKRIVGLPSEKIEIRDGKVFINGQVLNENYYAGETLGNMSITIAPDQYFVLGDNRTAGSDSRVFGPVNKRNIIGKYWLSLK